MDERQMVTIGIMIAFFALFLVLVNVLDNKSINGIKAKQVGDGQHGTARWATKQEIRRSFSSLPFAPSEWRQGKNLPNLEGTVVACRGTTNTTALVDTGDVHTLMIGAAGVGKTAYFLYPNIEFACASGMSFLSTDTKGDVARNYGETITVIQPSIMTETVKRRVAAYCRVSSSSEDQLGSYQAQLTYYSHKFEDSNTEELVDLHADEGITGTRDDKRDEFQRLMKDCRRGKIDRIYTKSISRFARNTKDCLKNLRELKSLGITVFFEKENIDTANMTDEIMITILGGLAQEESVSISQNMRWSVRKRMENGTYVLPSLPYGYTNEKESLIQIPEEIETVKWIFSQYLSGIKMKAIADELNNSGVPTHLNREKWMKNTIRYILTNPVYIGHLLLQKSYTANTFPFVRKDNHGEVPQYLIKNHHKAVISEEDYQRVQDLISENTKQNHTPIDTIFSKKIVCAHCGTYFRRKANKKTVNWVCRTRDNRADSCPIMHISEQKIQQLYIRLFNVLFAHYKEILLPLQQMLQELKCKKYGGNVRVMDIHKEIAKFREQNHVIARLRTKGFMDEGKYQEQSKELNNKIRKLQAELKKLTRSDDEDDILEQLDMLVDYFEKREHIMVSFEPETFDSMVDMITANQNELTFHLLGGIELKEEI